MTTLKKIRGFKFDRWKIQMNFPGYKIYKNAISTIILCKTNQDIPLSTHLKNMVNLKVYTFCS